MNAVSLGYLFLLRLFLLNIGQHLLVIGHSPIYFMTDNGDMQA